MVAPRTSGFLMEVGEHSRAVAAPIRNALSEYNEDVHIYILKWTQWPTLPDKTDTYLVVIC